MSLETFGPDQLAKWLESYCGLGKHAESFLEMGCDGETLLAMEKSDLRELGLNTVEVVKVMNKIRKYEDEQAQRPSASPASSKGSVRELSHAPLGGESSGGQEQPESPPMIFLSYGRETNVSRFVKDLKVKLLQHGVEVWLDVDSIKPGDNWRAAIGRGLDECSALVCVLTQKYVSSEYCQKELFAVQEEKKLVLPLLHEEIDWRRTSDASAAKYALSGINWVDTRGVTGVRVEEIAKDLATKVKEFCAKVDGGEAVQDTQELASEAEEVKIKLGDEVMKTDENHTLNSIAEAFKTNAGNTRDLVSDFVRKYSEKSVWEKSAMPEASLKHNAVKCAVEYLQKAEDPQITGLALKLVWITCRSAQNRDYVGDDLRGIPLIVEALRKHYRTAEAAEGGASAIHNMCAGRDNSRVAVGEAGGVKVLMDALSTHLNTVSCARVILGSFYAISGNRDIAEKIREAGAVPVVVRAMQAHADDELVQFNGAASVWNIALEERNKDELHKAGVEALLVNIARKHADSVTCVTKTFGAMWNMTVREEDRKSAILNGAIEVLIDRMKQHADKEVVITQAVGALKNITCSSPPNKKRIAEYGGINVIFDVIKRYINEKKIMIQAVGCVWNLSGLEDIRPMMLNEGVVRLIKQSMEMHMNDKDMSVKNLAAIWNMSAHAPAKDVFRTEGVIPLLTQALDKHLLDKTACIKGLAGVWNLSANNENKNALHASGAPQLIIRAMKQYPMNTDVQTKSLASVWNLSSTEQNKKTLGDLGVIPLICAAMRNFEKDTTILTKSMASFWNLTRDHPQNKARIANEGGIALMLKAIRENMHESEVVMKGWGALHNMSSVQANKELIKTETGLEVMLATMKYWKGKSKDIFKKCLDLEQRLGAVFDAETRRQFDALKN